MENSWMWTMSFFESLAQEKDVPVVRWWNWLIQSNLLLFSTDQANSFGFVINWLSSTNQCLNDYLHRATSIVACLSSLPPCISGLGHTSLTNHPLLMIVASLLNVRSVGIWSYDLLYKHHRWDIHACLTIAQQIFISRSFFGSFSTPWPISSSPSLLLFHP